MTYKETVPSLMENVMAVHTVLKAIEDKAGTVVKSDSDTTDYKPQPLSNPVVKPPSAWKARSRTH